MSIMASRIGLLGGRKRRGSTAREVSRMLAVAPAASAAAEQYQLLALNVMTNLAATGDRTVAIFSARPSEGRSTISLNLGVALARHSEVVLVGPRWDEPEVEQALLGPSKPNHRLFLLSENRVLSAPAEALLADAQGGSEAGYVIVDAPAAEASSDAYLVAQRAKNVLYVLPGGTTELDAHRRHIEQLRRLRVNVLGIVVNGS
jgi:Mrp family chromosome partitioning ATPase